MNLRIVSHGAIHLVAKRLSVPFWIRRRQLKKSQWFSASQLEQMQLKFLKRLIHHCYNTVPYYRMTMDELGITVESIRTLEDIKQFPVMTKNDILQAGGSLVSTKYPKCLLHTAYTGGTTGPRLPLKRNLLSVGHEHAFVRRQFDWCGIGMGDCCAYMTWRSVTNPNDNSSKFYAYDPFLKELVLSTFHLSKKTAKVYIGMMRKYGVKALIAYPSAAFVLAKSVLDSGRFLPLHGVLTTSETIGTNEKSVISQAFDCPVCDFYGSAERVCYIHTCEYGCYHLIPEYGLTELIRSDSPNDDCFRLISTGFWNMAMPLIRYDTRDMVKPSDRVCQCGRVFPVIEEIVGRENKSITSASGRTMGLTVIGRLFKNVLLRTTSLPIFQSQFILEEDGSVCFEFIGRDSFSLKDANTLKQLLAKELPSDLEVRVREGSQTTTSSGKSISLVKG